MTFLISYGLVFLASFFDAICDAVENENINESIFRKLDQRFWSKRESWKYVKKIFGYRPDAWHLSKSCMIICFICAIIFFEQKNAWWLDIIIFGGVWNIGFWLFYNFTFKCK